MFVIRNLFHIPSFSLSTYLKRIILMIGTFENDVNHNLHVVSYEKFCA